MASVPLSFCILHPRSSTLQLLCDAAKAPRPDLTPYLIPHRTSRNTAFTFPPTLKSDGACRLLSSRGTSSTRKPVKSLETQPACSCELRDPPPPPRRPHHGMAKPLACYPTPPPFSCLLALQGFWGGKRTCPPCAARCATVRVLSHRCETSTCPRIPCSPPPVLLGFVGHSRLFQSLLATVSGGSFVSEGADSLG